MQQVKDKGLKALYPDKTKIAIGMATCGLATGAGKVLEALIEAVGREGLDVVIAQTGCIGFCQREPVVHVLEPAKPRIIYQEMTPAKAQELVSSLKNGGNRREWALCRMQEEDYLIEGKVRRYSIEKASPDIEDIPPYQELDFYKKQLKIVLRNCGFIDPENIEEYIAKGGYFSLFKVLYEMTPQEVIEEVKKSGLRGRGGAGFPTGSKWESCRQAEGAIKYVICNADEGDPGAYMDRSVLEGDPHSVLEGMIIGAYAIGAHEGYIYVRNEYPLAIDKIRKAIRQAEEYGLLGQDILGSGFDFTIKINRGGGAFVCGESTALMASLEGKIGEPRAKYVHTVEKGLRDRPSNLNNVETWANIPVIIARGADWYSKIGIGRSKGTKVFSVVGKINNTGLVEVAMGITLREIIYDIGGGILGGKRFKAVQTGGPSGGCIPEDLIDLPVGFDELTKVGSMMGSGGMIVMDEGTCMVDIAKYFLSFLEGESCGKCVPCREGIKRAAEILTDMTEGKGREVDIELLQKLATILQEGSLCALGTTAANPLLTTLRYFGDEYEAHIKDKKCPAGVCVELIQYFIDSERCEGCLRCLRACPQGAISGEKRKPHVIDQSKCIKCGACTEVCKFEAILKE
ncbi:MAG: NADH-quinone oxidoreductase subunit NuoF [Dehalococcoidia bacterium]|nr:MAG: NADH-quinone oxidoreductase subunit NuoF [Dehalococcoidia bacterium]